MYLCRILFIGIFYTLYKICILNRNKCCILSESIAHNSKRIKHIFNLEKLPIKHKNYKTDEELIGYKNIAKFSFVNNKTVNIRYSAYNNALNSSLTEDEPNRPSFNDLDDWNDHRLVDLCEILVSGGDGGDGCLSFRREKHVPLGRASGGNGGPGGDVIIKCDLSLGDLKNFNYNKIYKAEKGSNGKGSNRNGAKGKDLYLYVPPGTVVYGENNEVYSTLLNDGEKIRIARGGRGGKGNRHFITGINNAPRVCERGEPGVSRKIRLIFKKLSDIALVGKPNSGKSSIIKQLTNAKPRVANFPFSTRFPIHGVIQFQEENRDEEDAHDKSEEEDFFEGDFEDSEYLTQRNESTGVCNRVGHDEVECSAGPYAFNVDADSSDSEDMSNGPNGITGSCEGNKPVQNTNIVKNLMIVDIPGLILGSSSGRGLGHDFLRHIERCKIISYVIDSSLQDPVSDYLDVKKEIVTYDSSLLKKPEIILLNKIDLIDNKRIFELMNSFIKECDHDRIYFLSAKTRENIDFISLLFNQIYKDIILDNRCNINEESCGNLDKNESGPDNTKPSPANSSKCNIEKLDEFRNLSRRIKIEHEDGIFTLKSPFLERKVKMMRFDLPETLDRLRHMMKLYKIKRRLVKLGLKPGDVLKIGDVSFSVQTDEFFI